MQEKITIEFVRYRDKDGEPTCATDFRIGEVCEFYRTQRFGCNETCALAVNTNRYLPTLDRRGDRHNGSLIPGHWCRLWQARNEINR